MNYEMVYELNDEKVKEFEKSCQDERRKHQFKSRYSNVGIANAFGSVAPEPFDEVFHMLHGFDLPYLVSNKGRVISLSAGRQLKTGRNESGYSHVGLYVGGEERTYKVATLVATAFCPNALNKEVIHHIDKEVSNNSASNLIWVTKQQHKDLHRALKPGSDQKVYYALIEAIRAENEGRA